MDRRRLLSGLSAAALAGFAGCAGYQGSDGGRSADSGTETPEAFVARSELQRGARKDAIPAITEPAFGPDWSAVDAAPLQDTNEVIGIVRNGEARAYPLRILNWHEIVNESFDGPLLVTYCPLCGSAVSAARQAGGEPTLFGVSGLLYKNDLVMYDQATDSLWSQIEARAINGELVGEELQLVPSTLTTWGEWTVEYPDTSVLLPPPESGTITDAAPRGYDTDPYGGYEFSSRIGIGGSYDDDRLHPKATVLGVTREGDARAYPLDRVIEAGGVVNDEVGDTPIVVAVTGDGDGSLVGYERQVDGESLTFEKDGAALVAGGSQWNPLTGGATDGPYEGTTLTVANERSPMFFFAWLEFYPETTVYGG